MLELREVVGHHEPLAGRRPPIHVIGFALDRRAPRGLGEARHIDGHHHHRCLLEHDARLPHRLHARHARHRRQLRFHRARETNRANDDALGRRHEQVGVERRFHPVDDRIVTGARHPGECHHERQRQHERGHARRGAAGRLQQAVRGERALDGPQPFQHRPECARQADRQHRADEQRGHNRHDVAGVEDRTRSAHHEAHDGTGPADRRQQSPQPVLSRRQDLILPLLQGLHRIDARRVARRNHAPRRCWWRCRSPERAARSAGLVDTRRRAARRRTRRSAASRSSAAMPRAMSIPNTSAASEPMRPVTALSPRNSPGSARASRRARAGSRSPIAAA